MPRLRHLSRSIAGRSAIVTGAAGGMGRATAQLFADEGAKVAVTDLHKEGVEAVVEEIRSAGGEAAGWTMDVCDPERIQTVIPEIAGTLGSIDILVNNAGFADASTIEADDFEATWAHSMDGLLTAHTRTIRAALPFLRKSDGGRIVNISSTEGWGATKVQSAYTAAKHGVIGLTKAMALELSEYGITVNCICPGPIRTGITAEIEDKHKEIFAKRRTALRRYGEPEEVAHGTLNFVLPASQYMTGAILPVDGGLLIRNA